MEKNYVDFTWQDYAACYGLDIDLFFLKQGGTLSQKVVDACETCPVREKCLTHALKYEEYGFWALTSPRDRIKMRKQLGIKLENIIDSLGTDDIQLSPDIVQSIEAPKRGRKKMIEEPVK